MSEIYVYSPNEAENEYSSFGLVGALTPTSCTFTEAGNGESTIEMTHPIDEYERYSALHKGYILSVPVPVRTTPEIQNGSCVTTVWTYKVKPHNQLTSKKQRTLYKKKTGSGRLKYLSEGEVVTVVLKPVDSGERWKVKSAYGTGWIDPNGFELVTEKKIDNNANAIQEVQSPWNVRPQYFRIYETEKSMTEIQVRARHISYDLLYNLTNYTSDESVTTQTALDGVLNGCINKNHGFSAYTNVANEQSGLNYRGDNPINAFLDPDEGICAKFKVSIVRDNYELYFLADPGMNRGVTVRYGKNMSSISYTVSDDEVTTRIMPVGQNKDGTPLYLSDNESERYIDSTRIKDYPVIHAYYLQCDNCTVGQKDSTGSKVTVDVARARMREQAEAMYKTGCDLPSIKMEVSFINLGDTVEYSYFKGLENCFLYDYIIVQHPTMDINVTAQIQQIEWDVLKDRMNGVTIGTVGTTLANAGITTWQIPSGFSGSKIAYGTIGGSALSPDVISTRHLQAGSVNADIIAAGSVTANHLEAVSVNAMVLEAVSAKIHDLAAGTITTDQLYADLAKIAAAQITTANIKNANIDWATIENLSAQIAAIAKAEIEDANIGFAQIDGLEAKIAEITLAEISKAVIHAAQIDDLDATVAEIATAKITSATIKGAQIEDASITSAKIALGAITAALIEKGAIGTAQIADGSITEAKIVSLNADVITAGTLSVDRLLIKGPNGLFRAINATDDGLTSTELSQEEYQNGMSGTVLVARSVTADKIAAKSITANEILGGTITAAEIDVSNLFAAEAVITQLDNYILRAATIEAIEGKLDIWANDKISIAVRDKADKGSVDELSGRVSTNETAIKATQDSLSSKVSQTEVDQAIASLVIGGRNLLRWTANIARKDGYGFDSNSSGADNKGSAEWIDGSVLVTNDNANFRFVHTDISVTAGEAMTVSAEYKDVSGDPPHQFQMEFYDADGHRAGSLVSLGGKTTLPDGWVRSVFTFTVPGGAAQLRPFFRSGEDFTAYTHSYYIRHPKLERGDKATDWTPAPEDDAGDILSLTGRVTTAESNITQQADQIKTKVSQSDFNTGLAGKADAGDLSALKTRVSSAESSITQNANAISSKVSQSDFNALGQRVSSAESSISQTPNQISAAVSAVKVGSRNYILGTAAAYPALGGGSERRWLFPWKCAGFDVLKTLYGKTVTISFDYDQWINSGSFQVMINLSWQGVVTLDSNGNGNNKHFEKTMTLNTVTFENTNENALMYIDGTWSGTVTFRNVKMEVGNKATDWTAAPEDSIGGTNLLYCSNDMGASGNHGFWTDSSGADNKGVGEWQADGSVLVTNNNSNFRFGQSGITVTDGDVLTISAEYKDVSGDPPHQFQVTIYDSSGNQYYNYANVGAKTNIGGGWVRSSYTFAVPYGGASMNAWFRSGTDYTLYTHSYYIRRAKLERGSVASDWSQNPEEVRIGSAIILDERHTEIKTPYLDIDVTGTNGDTHIDENGLATGTGTFDHVNCPELVPSVPGQTFTVTTSSGLQEVFDKLGGSVVNGNVTIDIQVDQYGTFMLRGLHGRWSTIEIQAHWHSINGAVILGDCYTNAIRFYHVLFNGDGSVYPLGIYNSGFVDVQHSTINGNNANRCIDINNGSRVFIWDVGLYNATNLIRMGHTTDASIVNILGGNCTSYLRADGARFTMSGTRPDGSYAEENTCLKAPSDPNGLTIDYGTAQPTVTPVTTASFTASATGTFYPSNHFIKSDNIIRQGYEGSGSSARADYGCMWFGASALSGKTIKSATLSLTRIKGKGGSSAVTLTLYTSPLTGKDGNLQDGLTSHGEIGSIANGERLQVNIPVEAVSTVAAGGALVLYTGETSNASGKSYSRHYAHFEGTDGAAPVLTVTYQ